MGWEHSVPRHRVAVRTRIDANLARRGRTAVTADRWCLCGHESLSAFLDDVTQAAPALCPSLNPRRACTQDAQLPDGPRCVARVSAPLLRLPTRKPG